MKIAVVVPGRFHAFDLARALIRRGHHVRVFTNYPKRIAGRFGLSSDSVESYLTHGVLSRALHQAARLLPRMGLDPLLHRMFGRWAARAVAREHWDMIYVFTGVAEEILRSEQRPGTLRLAMRGSSHIRTQDQLLAEETARSGMAIERPRPWIIAREEREYALSDRIHVLSTFAYRSFVANGVPPEKLAMIPLGVDTALFRAHADTVAERCRRIRAGEPLRVLFTGTASYRKGVVDLVQIIRRLNDASFRFRLMCDIHPEAARLVDGIRNLAEVLPRQPQLELPRWYSWADVFLFPTIEDGYAVVLAQAQANALPILTTTNCSGPDIVRQDVTGWMLPIRDPEAFIERLQWCDANRDDLAGMIERIHHEFRPFDWNDVAAAFEKLHARPAAVSLAH
jgi:glycosyltransferase involved in cell wall biosynthesis